MVVVVVVVFVVVVVLAGVGGRMGSGEWMFPALKENYVGCCCLDRKTRKDCGMGRLFDLENLIYCC